MSGTKTDCCSVDFIKCVLSVFNVIVLVAGVLVLITGIWTVTDKYQYVTLLSTVTYPIITYFLLAAGALVLLISILGFCAVFKENQPLLLFYLFTLLLIFLIEAMVGIVGFIYQEQVRTDLKLNLNQTFMSSYKINEEKTEAIDYLQDQFQCCGATDFDDWKYSKWKKEKLDTNNLLVPDSCCKTRTVNCGRRNHPSNINDVGCIDKMEEHIRNHILILSSVGLVICFVQLFGIICSCNLYCKLTNRK